MFPCKDCLNRHVGCHIDCEVYNNARILNDERREQRRIAKKQADALVGCEVRRHSKSWRNNKRRVGK